MKKWYDEEYEFSIEVTGFLHGDHTFFVWVFEKNERAKLYTL